MLLYKVMVCGGNQCVDSRRCTVETDCYEWLPGRSEWALADNGLNSRKWAHFMGLTASVDDPGRQVRKEFGIGQFEFY